MKQVYYSDVSQTPPSMPASATEGYPQDGTVSGNAQATVPGAYWFYSVASEIENAIRAGGQTPDVSKVNQLAEIIGGMHAAMNAVSYLPQTLTDAQKRQAKSNIGADAFANVRDYGAKGDGEADDTAAFKAALEARTGVFVPAGTYLISETLEIPAGACMIGEGHGYGYQHPTTLLFCGTGTKAFSIDCGSWSVANPDTGAAYLADSGTRGDNYATLDLTEQFSAAVVLNPHAAIRDIAVILNYNGIAGYADNTLTGLGDNWDIGIWARNASGFLVENVLCRGYWRKAGLLVSATDIGDGATPENEHGSVINSHFSGYRGVAIRSSDNPDLTNWGLAGLEFFQCRIDPLNHASGRLATSSFLDTPFSSASACLEIQGATMRGLDFRSCTLIGREDISIIAPAVSESFFTSCYLESRNFRDAGGAWQSLVGSRIVGNDTSLIFTACARYGIDLSPRYARDSSVTRYAASAGTLPTGASVRDDEYIFPRFRSVGMRMLPGATAKIWNANFDEVCDVDQTGNVTMLGSNLRTKASALNIVRNAADASSYVMRVYASGNVQFPNGTFSIGGHLYPITDNSVSCGSAAHRWTEVFAAAGAINTSDKRQKDNIAAPSDALMRAWGKVRVQVFQFKDALAKKGDDARLHIGLIAQDVAEAFASEGLDAARYGLLCHDSWDDEYEAVEVIDVPAVVNENGEEVEPAKTHTERRLIRQAGDAYGIRYSEALALECAYLRWRLERLEAKINGV